MISWLIHRLVEKVFVGNIWVLWGSLKKLCYEFLGLDEKWQLWRSCISNFVDSYDMKKVCQSLHDI